MRTERGWGELTTTAKNTPLAERVQIASSVRLILFGHGTGKRSSLSGDFPPAISCPVPSAAAPKDLVCSSVCMFRDLRGVPLQAAHAVPHEVLIVIPMILQKCNSCADVRFSLRSPSPEPIGDSEFFL
jgi:hypothetical protein